MFSFPRLRRLVLHCRCVVPPCELSPPPQSLIFLYLEEVSVYFLDEM